MVRQTESEKVSGRENVPLNRKGKSRLSCPRLKEKEFAAVYSSPLACAERRKLLLVTV